MAVEHADALDLPNLASNQLGAKIVHATDEWFSEAPNLLKETDAHFDENTFTEYGKEMDGWECRRRRKVGNDWAIIKLGLPGLVDTIEVNTQWFTGNFSPQCSILSTYYDPADEPKEVEQLFAARAQTVAARGDKASDGRMGLAATNEENNLAEALYSDRWETVVPLQPLGAGYTETCRTFFKLPRPTLMSHLRLNMGPDGGIARIRCYGMVSCRAQESNGGEEIDLAYVENGGIALGASDAHYGHPRNMTNPGRGRVMGDGWETARQPLRPASYETGPDGQLVMPGNDWAVLQLGTPGTVSRVDVDTNHYKGNYPESCLIEACYIADGSSTKELKDRLCRASGDSASDNSVDWFPLLPRSQLSASAQHFFDIDSAANSRPVSHVKITIYPDGGVQRLRIFGRPAGPKSRL